MERIASILEAMIAKPSITKPPTAAAERRIPTWEELDVIAASLSVRARNCLQDARNSFNNGDERSSVEYLLTPRLGRPGRTNLTRIRNCGLVTQAEILGAVERWRAGRFIGVRSDARAMAATELVKAQPVEPDNGPHLDLALPGVRGALGQSASTFGDATAVVMSAMTLARWAACARAGCLARSSGRWCVRCSRALRRRGAG